MADTKKFLDNAGLTHLWGIIKGRFADKSDAVGTLTIETSTDGQTQKLIGTKVGNGGLPTTVNLPMADRDQAGLMNSTHFALVDNLQQNIKDWAPFHGLQLTDLDTGESNELTIIGQRASVALKYESDGAGNAYISLVDPNYPEGTWEVTTAEAYQAAEDKTKYHTVVKSGVTSYYKWTGDGAAANAPMNALKEPIMSAPISKIDVTELVKTGLLLDSDVVVDPAGLTAGTYLKLTFNAFNENGESSPQIQYINVTDLVEIYKAGEGITITETGTGVGGGKDANDDMRVGTITVNAAEADKLGAIRTGYDSSAESVTNKKTYAVQLDANKNAYVAVPWNETKVAVTTTDTDDEGAAYLVTDVTPVKVVSDTDGSTTTTYNISVEVGDGIKNAEAAARTGIQNIVGDAGYVNVAKTVTNDYHNEVTVTLDQTVKDSLALADTAVQTIAAGNRTDKEDLVVTVSGNGADDKGKKAYTVALGSDVIASLDKADSAMQEITVLGKTLNQDTDFITAAEATLAMSLGSAANVNITEDGTLATTTSTVAGPADAQTPRKTVATTEAVKTYVDTVVGDASSDARDYVDDKIEGLDSSVAAAKTGAANHAQGVDAQQVFTKIVIKDGKLVGPNATDKEADEVHGKSEVRYLTLSDITDFRPFTEAEITAICV